MPDVNQDIIQKIEEEHEAVDRYLEDIKKGLSTWKDSEDLSLWKIEFIWQLREFKNNILKHFDFEEDCGFFEQVSDTDSKEETFAKSMKIKHRGVISEINKILAKLRKIKEFDKKDFEQIKSDIFLLTSDISKHEQQEIKIIKNRI